jgi:isoquinoline 1-oxidoreductase beta subunit
VNAQTLSRNDFLRVTSTLGAGLGLAVYLPACSPSNKASPRTFAPNAWVRIAPDDTVTVYLSKSEMGQGVATGLPTILADELDASIDRVRVECPPYDARYVDPMFGEAFTGGSTSTPSMWMPLREAGAAARAMLVAAAAKEWSVDPSSCTTKTGVVYHTPSNRQATYGSLADAAASLPVPQSVPLKTPDRFTLIGKPSQRTDVSLKVNGTAQYGIDVRVSGMLYAAIRRSPVFGGSVRSFDASKAKAVPGVVEVVQISNGVAVVAKNTWAAFQGKKALNVAWDDGPNARVSTNSLFAEAEMLAKTHSGERVAIARGNAELRGGTVVEATYRGGFLAHATMEPPNATADVREDRCEVWAPTQAQTRAQGAAVKVTCRPKSASFIRPFSAGGSDVDLRPTTLRKPSRSRRRSRHRSRSSGRARMTSSTIFIAR